MYLSTLEGRKASPDNVTMKQVIATRLVDIPDEVKLEVRARKVRVKGPRGEQH